MAASREVIVRHKEGLHARPAVLFVQMASRFAGTVTVENLTKGSATVNAKSILSVLSAAVHMDDRVRIVAEGKDEETAVAALCELIQGNFSETG